MKENKKKILFFGLIVFVLIALISTMVFALIKANEKPIIPKGPGGLAEPSFNNKIIGAIHDNIDNTNYMISPYSLEVVFSMLRDGASGTTLDELNTLVPEREIKTFSAKERINIANALFIKNGVIVKDDFKNTMTSKYKSKIILDDFVTPKAINDWSNQETYGMIPKVLENINPRFLLGLGNAVAIDIKWQSQFECSGTRLEEFNTIDNNKINVAMMHQTYEHGASYYSDSKATYVSIPYRKYGEDGEYADNGTQLEFIGILPNEDVNEYVNNFNYFDLVNNIKEMKSAGDELNIRVSLPKFKFDYDVKDLVSILKDLGLKETLGPKPNFEKIADYDMSISDVIHKTHIDLSEVGTKAAAVTLVTFKDNALPGGIPEVVEVNFNKPFVYLIKDSNSDEVLFFGVVYEPTKYTENDILCEQKEEVFE